MCPCVNVLYLPLKERSLGAKWLLVTLEPASVKAQKRHQTLLGRVCQEGDCAMDLMPQWPLSWLSYKRKNYYLSISGLDIQLLPNPSPDNLACCICFVSPLMKFLQWHVKVKVHSMHYFCMIRNY